MVDGVCLSLDTESASPEARVQVSLLYRDPAGALCAEQQIVSAPLPNLTLPDGARPCDLSARVSASPGSDGNVPLRITVSGHLITQSRFRCVTLQHSLTIHPVHRWSRPVRRSFCDTFTPLFRSGKSANNTHPPPRPSGRQTHCPTARIPSQTPCCSSQSMRSDRGGENTNGKQRLFTNRSAPAQAVISTLVSSARFARVNPPSSSVLWNVWSFRKSTMYTSASGQKMNCRNRVQAARS